MTDSADDDGRPQTDQKPQASASPGRVLTPAAARALAEAEERRREGAEGKARQAKEIDGRDGPDPVRYGDWEVKGIASDF
ncbi:MAG: DUF1674 domain-containing protein [Bradyrhizobium sp.]